MIIRQPEGHFTITSHLTVKTFEASPAADHSMSTRKESSSLYLSISDYRRPVCSNIAVVEALSPPTSVEDQATES